ncbi:MAG: DUF5666 domain-containing protein [Halobacteriota archaeon]
MIHTVHFSASTRFYRQAGTLQEIKASDIKVGDAIGVRGEREAAANSVNAERIFQFDPQIIQRRREEKAKYGKTWLMGTVTALNGVKVTLQGSVDNSAHTVVVNESTTFRDTRKSTTLADIKVGHTVRVDGAPKDGTFVAISVFDLTPLFFNSNNPIRSPGLKIETRTTLPETAACAQDWME